MKISHGRLEAVRTDLTAFTAEQHFNPRSKWRTLQFAAYEYHRNGSQAAIARFDRDFHNQFKGVGDFDELAGQLELYVARHRRLGKPTVEFQRRVHLDLTPTVWMSGEVHRVDLEPMGGFALCLWFPTHTAWQGELRMPLLQYDLAMSMGVPVSSVRVTAYIFDSGELQERRYSRPEIDSALAEATALAVRMSQL
jgi:hypothetical protein